MNCRMLTMAIIMAALGGRHQAVAADAPAYPVKPIRWIVPFAPTGSDPAQFQKFIGAEIAKWSRVSKEAGIRAEQ